MSQDDVKQGLQEIEKAKLLDNMRQVVPTSAELDGLPDIHTFTMSTFAGIEFELKPLIFGGGVGFIFFMIMQAMLEMSVFLALPIALLAVYKVTVDFSSAGDGVKKKNEKVRKKLDKRITSVVRGGVPKAPGRRILIISGGRELDHKTWTMEKIEASAG
jgi:hypothetical protein